MIEDLRAWFDTLIQIGVLISVAIAAFYARAVFRDRRHEVDLVRAAPIGDGARWARGHIRVANTSTRAILLQSVRIVRPKGVRIAQAGPMFTAYAPTLDESRLVVDLEVDELVGAGECKWLDVAIFPVDPASLRDLRASATIR